MPKSVSGVDAIINRLREADVTLWCPICRTYHAAPIGVATDRGVPTRACPRVPTDSAAHYYSSTLYTGPIT